MWKKKYNRYILFVVLLTPLWMWLAWLFSPKTELPITIVDKTVLNNKAQEHASLMWLLKHEKYVKPDHSLYQTTKDYYGFFPKRNETYEIKGLEQFSTLQLDSLASASKVIYLTDAYGIYQNEWYGNQNNTERSGIVYGGMSSQDLYLLKQMKAQGKLVLTEFNCLGSPTEPSVRKEFEQAFGITWTGWIGRYFDVLDTAINQELPDWLIRNYINQHGSWPFKKSGIAFVRENDRVVILENQTHLEKDLPEMITETASREYYDLPGNINYSFWFDIISVDTPNTVHANFRIHTNQSGAETLRKENIPATFPAIISSKEQEYAFWYFACDFSDNPISTFSAYFKGIHFFKRMFYNSSDPSQRGSFFWNVYRPLVTKILADYSNGD